MKKRKNERGATLVEVMLCVLLMFLVVSAGGAFIVSSARQIAVEKSRRAALEIANGTLETLRAQGFDTLSPAGSGVYFLTLNNKDEWITQANNPNDTVSVNGTNRFINRTAQLIDDDGDTSEYEFLLVTVQVEYRQGLTVTLQTYLGPR